MIGRAWITPRFVTVDEALAFHAIAIREHGGDPALLDPGKLEGAVNQVRQPVGGEYAYVFPFEMAAVYAHGIAMAHPFADGSKRVALVCAASFLRLNGWDLISEGEEAASALLGVIARDATRDDLARWLQAHTRRRSSIELRDLFAGFRLSDLGERAGAFRRGTQQELVASIFEAGVPIPAALEASVAADKALKAGEHETAAVLGAQAVTLAAIFRYAEDRGYEW